MHSGNPITTKLFHLIIVLIETIFIKPLFLLCRFVDRFTKHLRYRITSNLFPTHVREICHNSQNTPLYKIDDNIFYVLLRNGLSVSPQYVVNRIWITAVDTISSYLPLPQRTIDLSIATTGFLSLIGINDIEVVELRNNVKMIVERLNMSNPIRTTYQPYLFYDIDEDNLVITGVIKNLKSILSKAKSVVPESITVSEVDEIELISHTDRKLVDSIDRLSLINSKIHYIATRTLPQSHPIMLFLHHICRETAVDRALSFRGTDLDLGKLDLSSIHRYERCFSVDNEPMFNFYHYKYCRQMQKVLGKFVINFCEMHADSVASNRDVENFVKVISSLFRYDGTSTSTSTSTRYHHNNVSDEDEDRDIHETILSEVDENSCRDMPSSNTCTLTVADILLAVIFNVVEYSMNRIFLEHYYDYQKYFPMCNKYHSNSRYVVTSTVFYSSFMDAGLDDLVGRTNRVALLNSMNTLYNRFKADKTPFVECINPYKMKQCVLTC